MRGAPPQVRLDSRTEHSGPIIAALKPWFEKQLSMISSGSTLATDIRYALSHWDGLTRFLEDGRLELDTNPFENAIRPVALTRKNALFAGHEVGAENWALLASVVATCKLSDVNPVAYIAETLQAILNGHPQSRVEELMPWNFRKASSPNALGIGKALTSHRKFGAHVRITCGKCLLNADFPRQDEILGENSVL
uniref:Probable transposase n=1 Tax=Rhizobium loti TaxID=381 RepID=M5AMX6_RHILI|nr:probable transposase [Mesorhizobium loti NZP2037]